MITLFKSIEEINAYITVDISSRFSTILPYIVQSHKWIIEIVGETLFNSLIAAYNSETPLDNNQQALLEKCQYPLANYAYLAAVPKMNINVGETGFTTSSGNNFEIAAQWRVEDFKKSVAECAADGIELLLAFLETYPAEYPEWTASPACTANRNFFINSAREINQTIYTNITRIQFIELRKDIRIIEDEIKRACGEALYEELKTQYQTAALTDDNKVIVDLYIRNALAYLAVNLQGMPNQKFKEQGERYLQQMYAYLQANADIYPLFKQSPNYVEAYVIPERNTSNSGFFVC